MADHPFTGAARTRRSSGFTLSELLVTIGIVAIATAMAVPSLREFIQNTDVTTQADYVIGAVNYTRSEAIKRNTRVTMCVSNDGAQCATAAPTNGWRAGWIIFTDGSTLATVDGTDQILRVQSPLKGNADVIGTGNVAMYVSYVSSGQARLTTGLPQSGPISVCSNNVKVDRRRLTLSSGTGYVGVTRLGGSTSCTGP